MLWLVWPCLSDNWTHVLSLRDQMYLIVIEYGRGRYGERNSWKVVMTFKISYFPESQDYCYNKARPIFPRKHRKECPTSQILLKIMK